MAIRSVKGRLYVRFERDGAEHSHPTGLADTERNQEKARKIEARLLAEVESGRLPRKIKAVPFSDAADSFLSWASGEYPKRETFLRIRSSFGFLRHHFGRAILSSLTVGQLEDFKAARRAIGIAEVSIRHDLHSLSLMFQYAEKQGWARENIVRKVAMPSDRHAVRINVLTDAAERLYFDCCIWMDRAAQWIAMPDRGGYRDLHDFGRLMIQQGCRPEEIIELRKDAVDLIGSRMSVVDGKSKAAVRRLKLTAESRTILRRRLSTPGPFVFGSPRNCGTHRGPTWRVHYKVLEATEGRPDAMDFVVYDFRHTFATRAVLDGMPLPVLAKVLGHSNLKSIEKYIHISEDQADAEMDRIEVAREARKVGGKFPGTALEIAKFEERIGYSGGSFEVVGIRGRNEE
jgi:integrase